MALHQITDTGAPLHRGLLHAALEGYLPPAIRPRRAPAVAEVVEREAVVLTAEQIEMADDMAEAFA